MVAIATSKLKSYILNYRTISMLLFFGPKFDSQSQEQKSFISHTSDRKEKLFFWLFNSERPGTQISNFSTRTAYSNLLVISCPNVSIEYLDITLNLLVWTYKPYQKTENILQYIHKESNQPPYIIKQTPITIET